MSVFEVAVKKLAYRDYNEHSLSLVGNSLEGVNVLFLVVIHSSSN